MAGPADDFPLLDPRGALRRTRLTLAPRAGREALAGGTVVFYDNEKMDVGHFGRLFPRIAGGLAAQGITRFHHERASVRGTRTADLAALARRLCVPGARGAVIALADMGVSPAMVALAVELERLGLPTVCLTAGPGSRLASAHAHYRAGRLCLLPFDIHPGTEAQTIDRLVDASLPRLLTQLTAQGPALEAVSRVDHPVDPEDAAADGQLVIDPAERAAEGGDALLAVHAAFERRHLGDGLPFVPPTAPRLQAMRAWCPFDLDEVLFEDIGPSGTPMRVREVLIAAVMAGCPPPAFPVLLSAMRAIGRPAYGLRQAVTTSFSGGHYTLASGPIARQAGVHGGQGCLGPGFRANASIGRAINLALINVCRSVPGQADLACLSSPAEYAYCMAEDPSLSPWPTLDAERLPAGGSQVMCLKAEPPHAVMDFASTSAASLMGTVIDACTTLGSNNAYVAGSLVLVLTPDHASLLVQAGYDKARLRHELHAAVKVPLQRLAGRGIVGVHPVDDGQGAHRVTRRPEDIQIVVAGGKGGHSAVILPWSLHAEAVHEPIRLPDGRLAPDLSAFRVGH